MTEEQFGKSLSDNERAMLGSLCNAVRDYEGNYVVFLAEFVASLCDVEKEKMFSSCNRLDVAQARWLYWYAYRYLTKETYEKIGIITERIHGKKFTKAGVASSVNKMSCMIDSEPIWRKRWAIVKRILKGHDDMMQEPHVPITITVPRNVVANIKYE